jgi:hypothetical protein
MPKDDRDLLTVLKSELAFLEKGGYWKPSCRQPLIFQDAPTCLNYGCSENPRPCSECVLDELVPLNQRKEKMPCRHIPLNEHGETIDSLCRRKAQVVIETAVSRWLRATIQNLECERARSQSLPAGTDAKTNDAVKPLVNDVDLGIEATRFPKCANPECSASFHLKKGRLFRLHQKHNDRELSPSIHSVRHFWLCNACSESHTIECEGDRRVIITRSRDPKEPHFQASA